MTQAKSLKYLPGFTHRTHRSKKGRKKINQGTFLAKDHKRRKEALLKRELDNELKKWK